MTPEALRTYRRAAAAAQTILQENDPKMIIDGKVGRYTLRAYLSASAEQRQAIDALTKSLGVEGSIGKMYDIYASEVAVSANTGDSDQKRMLDLQLVPAIIRACRRRGLWAPGVIAQKILESGWSLGRVPLKADGTSSHNYFGIKWESYKTPQKSAPTSTREVVSGKNIRISDYFASFDSMEAGCDGMVDYLLKHEHLYNGISTARTAEQYARAVAGGRVKYATDPSYYQNSLPCVARFANAMTSAS